MSARASLLTLLLASMPPALIASLPYVLSMVNELVGVARCSFPVVADSRALDSAVTAQLVHWGLGLLLGFSAVILASQFVDRSWAWLGGCLVMAVPGITNQMTAPLNDVALAVFTTLSLIAWRRAMEDGRFRWFIVAGLMLGAALGIKYVALLFLAAVGVTQYLVEVVFEQELLVLVNPGECLPMWCYPAWINR